MTYTKEPGRWIHKNGYPLVRVALYSEDQASQFSPSTADELTARIVALLNEAESREEN